MSNFGNNFFFFQNIYFCFFGLLLVTYLGKSWKISRKSLEWIPRTILMNFRAKFGLKWPLLGRIRVFSQILPLVTYIKNIPLSAPKISEKSLERIPRTEQKRFLGKKWGKEGPVWHNCFFSTSIRDHFFPSIYSYIIFQRMNITLPIFYLWSAPSKNSTEQKRFSR